MWSERSPQVMVQDGQNGIENVKMYSQENMR